MKKLFSSIVAISFVQMVFGQSEIVLNIGPNEHIYKSVTENQIKFQKGQKVDDSHTCEFKFKQTQATDSLKNIEFYYDAISCAKKKKDSTTVLNTRSPRYPYAQNMTGLINKPINLFLLKKGLVADSIVGIDSITAHIYDSFAKQPDSVIVENTKYRIAETYGEGNVKSLIETITCIAPDSLIKKGGTWEKQNRFIGGIKASIKTNYQLKSATDSTYVVEGTSVITDGEQNKFTANGISYKLEEIDGTVKISATIDKASGLLKTGTYRIEAKAKATAYNMHGSTEDGIVDNIDIIINQKIQKISN